MFVSSCKSNIIYWTSDINVKYAIQRIKSSVSILSIYLINVSILSIYLINVIQCQRLWANSTTLLIPLEKEMWVWYLIRSNILFQYDEAKDVPTSDHNIMFKMGNFRVSVPLNNYSCCWQHHNHVNHCYSFYMIYCCILCIYNMLKKAIKKKRSQKEFFKKNEAIKKGTHIWP